jgi:hypothetical protein
MIETEHPHYSSIQLYTAGWWNASTPPSPVEKQGDEGLSEQCRGHATMKRMVSLSIRQVINRIPFEEGFDDGILLPDPSQDIRVCQ